MIFGVFFIELFLKNKRPAAAVLEDRMDAERIMQLRNFALRVEIPVASSLSEEEERENEEEEGGEEEEGDEEEREEREMRAGEEEEDVVGADIPTDVDIPTDADDPPDVEV